MVKCVVHEGRRAQSGERTNAARITHVREGQVLGAWRAVDGRVGYALLDVPTMAMISVLLRAAFPDARHVDVDEVLAVDPVGQVAQPSVTPRSGETRQTGT